MYFVRCRICNKPLELPEGRRVLVKEKCPDCGVYTTSDAVTIKVQNSYECISEW